MAKEKEVPITPAVLSTAAAKYDNFGHEMRVRALLEESGCEVEHGWTYTDPVEDKPRQFDLRALFRSGNNVHQIRMAIECKNLDLAAPLLISGARRKSAEAFLDYIVSDGTQGCRPSIVSGARSGALYPLDSFVGKSLLHLKPDKENLIPVREEANSIYNRWAQALASAVDLCARAALAGKDTGLRIKTAILPIVVLPDSTLWFLEYDRHGTPVSDPAPTNQASVFLKHNVNVAPMPRSMNLSHVNFYTIAGFRQFLASLKPEHIDWEDIFPAE